MNDAWSTTTRSPSETEQLGFLAGQRAERGAILLLEGHLGAGKTHFARGFARGLGVREPVTSPTFTIVAEYEGRLPFIHMDLYRLYEDPSSASASLSLDQLAQIGFEDYLDGQSVVVIEWAQGIHSLLEAYVEVALSYDAAQGAGGDSADWRHVAVAAHGDSAVDWVQRWVEAWPS